METLHTLKINDFQQPGNTPYSRTMQGPEEIIQYLPGSHVRIWCNTEPQGFDNHYHNCVEIIYMHEGNCNVSFATETLSLTTGDILIIPPYIMHQIESNQSFQQFITLLNIAPLNNFAVFSSPNSRINDILLCNKDKCPHIYDSIYNSLIDMINSYFTNDSYWEMETYSYFMQLLTVIGREASTNKSRSDSPGIENSKAQFNKFSELLQYINTNLSEPITLDSASSHVGFSKYHFVRLFKEYTGTTFYEYLTSKRIQHAQELLLSTDMGITEIAFSCGYNNQTSFCRSFKKVCGYPPTDYRQLGQSKRN